MIEKPDEVAYYFRLFSIIQNENKIFIKQSLLYYKEKNRVANTLFITGKPLV